MNWEAIGAVGELTGAVGVIATPGYLAYQIRQNTVQLEQSTLSTKAAAINASNVTLRENRQSIFEDAEMTSIFLLGTPGGRWFWEAYADNYPARFRAEVEQILEG